MVCSRAEARDMPDASCGVKRCSRFFRRDAYLGIIQHICGSIIYLLVFDTGLPGHCQTMAETIWQQLVAAYEALGTAAGERLPHAVFWAIFEKSRSAWPNAFPELHSKADVGRHAVPAVKVVTQQLEEWPLWGRLSKTTPTALSSTW